MSLITESDWHWKSIDDSVVLPAFSLDLRADLINLYDLCLTGEVSVDTDYKSSLLLC